MKKTFLLSIHSIAGLVAGIFIFALSVSGTLLLFDDEVEWVQQPNVSKMKDALSIDSCYNAVQTAYPHAEINSCNLPAHLKAISFFLYDSAFNKGTAAQQVFVNQFTAQIISSRGGSNDVRHNFMSWLSKFHTSFHAGKTGEWLLGVFAVVFVLSLITGIILYRKSVVAVLLFKKNVYAKKNLHQIVGVYALLFNLLMGISGYWMQRYVFKKDFYTVSTWIKTFKASSKPTFSLHSALLNIKKQYPAFTPHVIYFAQSAQSKTAVYGSNSTNSFIHSKKFADVIALDSNGAIAKTRFVNENTPSDYYDIVNSQVHMGKYGGLFIKLLYAVFGISGAVLSITGFLLWFKRK